MITRNETIYYIKGLAMISVISAHCNTISAESSKLAHISSLFLQNIGTWGVICFFVISGYLFHASNPKKFFLKKLKYICIPWIISATCVYLYVYLRKPPVSLSSWLNFVIGNGSYLYYLTVLMLLYVTFVAFSFMRTEAVLIICELVTVGSALYFFNIGGINPYLNPLNWIGYFAFGVQICKHQDIFESIEVKLRKCSWGIFILIAIMLVWQISQGNSGSYWNGMNTTISWLGAVMLGISGQLLCRRQRIKRICMFVHNAGAESFFVYLWHMPIAGIVARLMDRDFCREFTILRPLIVLIIVLNIGYLLEKIITKIKLQNKNFLFGIGH